MPRPSRATLLTLASRYRLRVRSAREIAAKSAQIELAYARVEELSRTDDLTALPNRRAILERLALEHTRSQRTGKPLAVALADVDDFKRFNDTLGHDCGDAVLRAVASTLRRTVRAIDEVGRLGGEEFLLVLPDTDLDGARLAAERARASVEATAIDWREHRIRVTITVGVCVSEDETPESTLRKADQAMYRGKHNGKNRVETASRAQSTRTA
ncbi:MAG: GGDEF domain-containing protein [Thermoanaerobaculaceae bacterium]|nr:GGDEF domain-containing protein [Thermoanaerobaculaceae bacterium]MDI9621062.1 GGDEF domain-containing protein [Acidobacteriota bacterium]NLH12505.1 GGDEF domain-containing protein [Holophagae bacterium]HPW56540.1 GGDEF domain-containing protein [Thermoanaerobaculaceae bacterium]